MEQSVEHRQFNLYRKLHTSPELLDHFQPNWHNTCSDEVCEEESPYLNTKGK